MPDGIPPARVAEGFDAALAAAPGRLRETALTIGGQDVLLRVVGERLAARLGRSFVPGDGGAPPALRLDLWDEEETGVGDPSGGRPNVVPQRWGYGGDRFALSGDGRVVRFSGPDFDIRLERDAGRAVGWVRDARLLDSWHRARPLQMLLLSWLHGLGMVVVHAAMVAEGEHGVVLAGATMAGKSTSAAACAAAGFTVLGDDAIAVERRADGGFTGHCVHAAIKLRRDTAERVPSLAAHAEPMGAPWDDEAVLFLPTAYPAAVAASAPIAALAFPRRVDRPDSRLVPLTRGRALAALTGAALSPEPGGVPAAFALLAEAAEKLPVHVLEVGTDPASVPAALSRAAVA